MTTKKQTKKQTKKSVRPAPHFANANYRGEFISDLAKKTDEQIILTANAHSQLAGKLIGFLDGIDGGHPEWLFDDEAIENWRNIITVASAAIAKAESRTEVSLYLSEKKVGRPICISKSSVPFGGKSVNAA
jgi:hypothetical protein